MRRIKITDLVLGIIFAIILALVMLFTGGCSERLLELERPDGTILRVKLNDHFSDKEIGNVRAEVDPATGVWKVEIENYNTKTSPIISDMLKTIYEAGLKAGAAGI